ncbi:hypothetical protein A9B99_11715 [Mangrovibacter phragmitis]|uniref:Uncharacterized protein n=1 Tax=Mangrovibacter phragmitis TaxID=1691903 RepID=A0A1B7L1S3_9ENTR|nr:hypothetical protein A9B99_11715 [Mangrovibacter phragmitis]
MVHKPGPLSGLQQFYYALCKANISKSKHPCISLEFMSEVILNTPKSKIILSFHYVTINSLKSPKFTLELMADHPFLKHLI